MASTNGKVYKWTIPSHPSTCSMKTGIRSSNINYTRVMVCVLFFLCLMSSIYAAQWPGFWYYENVALGKPSMQRSTREGAVASRANDGDSSGSLLSQSCSQTDHTVDTWWVVDLLDSYYIYAIQIKNIDTREKRSLKEFYVYVSETNPLPLPPTDGKFSGEMCLYHKQYLPGSGLRFLFCENNRMMKGRYVYVWKPGDTGYLYLCEVEVLTEYPLRDFTFILQTGVKSEMEPFHTERLAGATTAQCGMFCLNIEDATVNLMQFDKDKGICSCFENKPFDDTDGRQNVTANPSYDMIRRT